MTEEVPCTGAVSCVHHKPNIINLGRPTQGRSHASHLSGPRTPEKLQIKVMGGGGDGCQQTEGMEVQAAKSSLHFLDQ